MSSKCFVKVLRKILTQNKNLKLWEVCIVEAVTDVGSKGEIEHSTIPKIFHSIYHIAIIINNLVLIWLVSIEHIPENIIND